MSKADPHDRRSGAQDEIPIVIRNSMGEVLEVEVDRDLTVYAIKCRVAETWQVSPLCQKLTCGENRQLKDDEPLGGYCLDQPRGRPLIITMVISSNEVYKTLQDEDCAVRRMAVQTLPQMVREDVREADRARSALTSRLEDEDWEVRRAAVECVAQVAHRGDKGAMQAIFPHLEDRSVSVRQVSVMAMAQLAPEGDAKSIAAVTQLLEDRDDGVRRAVAEALSDMAPRGDSQVVQAVSAKLEHWSALVRRAAIEALASVAARGEEGPLNAISQCLKQEPGLLRAAAVVGFGQLSPKGDKRAIAMAKEALQDPDERVRTAAALVLQDVGDMSAARIADVASWGRGERIEAAPPPKHVMKRQASA